MRIPAITPNVQRRTSAMNFAVAYAIGRLSLNSCILTHTSANQLNFKLSVPEGGADL